MQRNNSLPSLKIKKNGQRNQLYYDEYLNQVPRVALRNRESNYGDDHCRTKS